MPTDTGESARFSSTDGFGPSARSTGDTAPATPPGGFALPPSNSGYTPDTSDSYMWNLDAEFKRRMQAFLSASGGRVRVVSGFRSSEHQQRLYNQAVAQHGAANAGRWAAPPGRSNHNHGLAMDLSFVNDAAKEWAHQNAARFGLEFPMSWEPWHVEPHGLANGQFDRNYTPDRDAYTWFDGEPHPQENSKSMMARLGSLLMGSLYQEQEALGEEDDDVYQVDITGSNLEATTVGDEQVADEVVQSG